MSILTRKQYDVPQNRYQYYQCYIDHVDIKYFEKFAEIKDVEKKFVT